MSAGDTVSRKVIIAVLRDHAVTVGKTTDGHWIIAKGDLIEKRKILDVHHRDFLHYLARRFQIDVHLFFHPPATLVIMEEEILS